MPCAVPCRYLRCARRYGFRSRISLWFSMKWGARQQGYAARFLLAANLSMRKRWPPQWIPTCCTARGGHCLINCSFWVAGCWRPICQGSCSNV
ncbi:hypothetical protein D9M71_828790 [compost metagenome]